MDKLYSISKTAEILDVTPKTLRIWDKENKLKPILTKGGHRRYKETDLNKIIGEESKKKTHKLFVRHMQEFHLKNRRQAEIWIGNHKDFLNIVLSIIYMWNIS